VFEDFQSWQLSFEMRMRRWLDMGRVEVGDGFKNIELHRCEKTDKAAKLNDDQLDKERAVDPPVGSSGMLIRYDPPSSAGDAIGWLPRRSTRWA